MNGKRQSGVLMHISSLPGNSGIGTFGAEAYSFADFLFEAGQSFWQVLPLGATSYGDSPYQSPSTFAGNPYFVDPKMLYEQGFATKAQLERVCKNGTGDRVDFAKLYYSRNRFFDELLPHFERNLPQDFEAFCSKNAFWLDNFALFTAAKRQNGERAFTEWDMSLRRAEPAAVSKLRESAGRELLRCKMLQYFFAAQWGALKQYVNGKGIQIIGDLPIYVAADSADVWTSPQFFELDDERLPVRVAGCPPDAFSDDGQLWGNPLYNWREMKRDGYSWWCARLRAAFGLFDVVRLDHFRGFEAYYAIDYGKTTAREGEWCKGPGYDLFETAENQLGTLPIIAENLGTLTPEVYALLDRTGFPGMRVLQFAFGSDESNEHLPHSYSANCVAYTGTHDNDTLEGWIATVDKRDIRAAKQYLECGSKARLRRKMMRAALESPADTTILTAQDLLGLGSEARMNIPSTLGGNWCWRALDGQLNLRRAHDLRRLTALYGRLGNG